MENEDFFYEIGMGFIHDEINDNSNIPSNDLTMFKSTTNNESRQMTSDGRDRDKFSIIMKPDESIPIPDTTGNGVATESYKIYSVENELSKYYNCEVAAAQAKSQLNNFSNILKHIYVILDDCVTKFKIDKDYLTTIKTLFNNAVRLNSKTNIDYNFSYLIENTNYNKIVFIIEDILEIINKFDPINFSNYDKYLESLNQNVDILNINKYKNDPSGYNFNNIFGTNLDTFIKILENLDLCFRYISKLDIECICTKNVVEIKKHLSKYNANEAEILKIFVDRIYDIGIHFEKFLEILYLTLIKYTEYFIPKKETKILIDESKLIFNIEKINPWVSADYHLLKELLHSANNDTSRTENIIRMHNKIVKPNDVFLFLGDISESEFFDNNVNPWIKDKLIECVKRLNGKKILLMGNNDTAPIDFYKKCGFIEIYKNPIITKKYIFSHGPVSTTTELINVHGHIHGSKNYWNIDWHNHIDCYYGLWGSPIKLNQLTNSRNMGFYYNGCKKLSHSPDDPELLKQPFNIVQ